VEQCFAKGVHKTGGETRIFHPISRPGYRNTTKALQRGAFCQFPFLLIHYCHSKSTGKETGKMHLCALAQKAKARGFLILLFSICSTGSTNLKVHLKGKQNKL
jgi:hypothetical protein